jgi:hypothetical protein
MCGPRCAIIGAEAAMAKCTNRMAWGLAVVLTATVAIGYLQYSLTGPPVQEGPMKLHPPSEWGVGRVVVILPRTPFSEKRPAVVAERYKLGFFSVRVK